MANYVYFRVINLLLQCTFFLEDLFLWTCRYFAHRLLSQGKGPGNEVAQDPEGEERIIKIYLDISRGCRRQATMTSL